MKMWNLAMQAIHFEVAFSLISDFFVNVLWKLITRRGEVQGKRWLWDIFLFGEDEMRSHWKLKSLTNEKRSKRGQVNV